MVITDPIADILVRIKNGGHAGKTVIYVPFSDMKLRLSNVLLKEGYVTSVVRKLKKGKRDERLIEIGIAYDAPRVPRVRGMERVSRPSRPRGTDGAVPDARRGDAPSLSDCCAFGGYRDPC